MNVVEIVIRACELEIQIARYESYFLGDPRDKREAKKEFKNNIKPSKLKETMVVFTTPTKLFSKPKKPNPRNKKSTLK